MKKILVLDDEEDICFSAKAALESSGFQVYTFTKGKEALKALRKGLSVDLALLDLRMPELSGQDVCEQIKSNPKTKNIKVVFFTASMKISIEEVHKMGALGYIAKPFDLDDFLKTIKSFLKTK